MPPKVKLAKRIVEFFGWKYDYTTGSHHHFKHDEKPGKVTISGHDRETRKPDTWKRVVEQGDIPRWLIRNYHLWKRKR